MRFTIGLGMWRCVGCKWPTLFMLLALATICVAQEPATKSAPEAKPAAEKPVAEEPAETEADSAARRDKVLAALKQADQLYEQGDYAKAIPLYEQVWAYQQAISKEPFQAWLTTLNKLKTCCERTDELDAATKYAGEEQKYTTQLFGPTAFQTIEAQTEFRRLEKMQQLKPADLAAYQQAKKEYDKGLILKEQNKLPEAKEKFKAAFTAIEKLVGPTDTKLIFIKYRLALLANQQQEHELAEQEFQAALDFAEKIRGLESPLYGIVQGKYGEYLHTQKKHKLALSQLQAAAKNLASTMGQDSSEYIEALSGQGDVYYAVEVYDEAETIFRTVLNLRLKLQGKNSPEYLQTLQDLGYCYLREQRLAEAELCFSTCLQGLRDAEQPAIFRISMLELELAELEYLLGHTTAASKQVAALRRQIDQPSKKKLREVFGLRVLYLQRTCEESLKQFEATLDTSNLIVELATELYGKESLEVARGLHHVAISHVSLQNAKLGIPAMQRALKITLQKLPPESRLGILYQYELAQVFQFAQDAKAAIANYEKLIKTLKEQQQETNDYYIQSLQHLSTLYAEEKEAEKKAAIDEQIEQVKRLRKKQQLK